MDKAPDAFRTISEVADELDLPQHVLRFWESRFAQIKPMKRGGGRRYYRPDDVALLRGIRHLLYGQGYTIRGVQRILRERGLRFVQSIWEEGAVLPDQAADDAGAEDQGGEPVSAGERREPTLSVPPRLSDPQRAPLRGALAGGADMAQLKAVLDDLTECRRLLDTALEEGA